MAQHNLKDNKHISPVSVGFALLCSVVAGWFVSLLLPSVITHEVSRKDLHKKTVVHRMDKVQERVPKTLIHEQGRNYIHRDDALHSMQNDAVMYKEKVRLMEPYRGEMIKQLRHLADHPTDDDMQLSHKQIDVFVEKGLHFD